MACILIICNPTNAWISSLRFSDRMLTDKVYTDENLLGTWAALDALPNYAERASQIASQIWSQTVKVSHRLSQQMADGNRKKTTATIGENPILTRCVTSNQDH